MLEDTNPVEPIPKIMGEYHCCPTCPYLQSLGDATRIEGRCLKTGAELDWYDFYLAVCVEQG